MNDEEINAILQMESPEYDRDGIHIYPNAAGRISISSERLGCEDLVTLDARNIEETCEVLLAFAKWLKLNTTTLDFIENKKQKGAPQCLTNSSSATAPSTCALPK